MSKSRLILALSAVALSCAAAAALVVSNAKKEDRQTAKAAAPVQQKPFCSECKTPTGRAALLTAAPAKNSSK